MCHFTPCTTRHHTRNTIVPVAAHAVDIQYPTLLDALCKVRDKLLQSSVVGDEAVHDGEANELHVLRRRDDTRRVGVPVLACFVERSSGVEESLPMVWCTNDVR